MTLKYNRAHKYFEIIGCFTKTSNLLGETLGTESCPMGKKICRKSKIGEILDNNCEKFLGTIGEESFRTHPLDQEILKKFRILCKGSNAMEFITED